MNKKERQNEIDKQERLIQAQAEQQERMIQMLAEARRPPPVTEPPLCTPRLTLHKYQEGLANMGAFLDTFVVTARVGEWPLEQWTIFLQSSLSGAGLTACAAMAADQQADYDAVRAELLREYHITTETFRRRMFDTPFDSTNPDTRLSKHRQHFQQWLSSSPLDSETTMLMEVTLRRLPKWLETQMRNLNPRSFKELSEAIVRHLANQPMREVGFPRLPERTNEWGRLRPETTFRPVLSGKVRIKLETDAQ